MVTVSHKEMGFEIVSWVYIDHDEVQKWVCKIAKEASSYTTRRQIIQIFQSDLRQISISFMKAD
jgi:hypothetical protein